ncbi:hypothetical protein AVEN_84615-1 [Araneus ventricosus]|uniref:Uncharacterized protein n=1 Tax=Araneus ventricosus TaxID=182803 RepID=A0A4Y2C155_ARAVE|nr:hypothetical protein AVEN_84615-1 [Araneus ventricosus]
MESRNKGREAVILSLYVSYLDEIFFSALSTSPVPSGFASKKNQIVPPDCYRLVLQELSDEEKACDYINVSDIIDKEHIEENYLTNSENKINDLEDIEDLSDDDSDVKESNYFMKTIYKWKTV